MGPRAKMVMGALLVLLGVWWYVPEGPFNAAAVSFSTVTNLQSLVAGLQGALGVLAILIGLFVVWIERDEMRIRQEMESKEFGDQFQKSVKAVAEGGEGIGEYVCEECGREFESERGLRSHRGQKH